MIRPVLTRPFIFSKFYPHFLLIPILILNLYLHTRSIFAPWYTDEAFNLALTQSILSGTPSVGPYYYFFIPHAPLSYMLSSPLLGLTPYPEISLRIIAVSLNFLSTLTLYYALNRLAGFKPALLGTFLYTIFYPATIYSQLAFIDYHLASVFVPLTVLAIHQYLDPKDDPANSSIFLYLTLSLSLMSSYYTAILLVPLFILSYAKKHVTLTTLIIALALITIFIPLLYFAPPQLIFEHLLFNLTRSSGYAFSAYGSLRNLIFLDPFLFLFPILTIGYLLRRPEPRHIPLLIAGLTCFVVLPSITFVQTNGTYALIPFYPLFFLAMTPPLYKVLTSLYRKALQLRWVQPHSIDLYRLTRSLLSIALLTLTALTVTYYTVNSPQNFSPYPEHLTIYFSDLYNSLVYLNHNLPPNALIVTSPFYLDRLNCKTSDYIYTSTFDGYPFYRPVPRPGDPDIKYNASLSRADYLLLDPFYFQWFNNTPAFPIFESQLDDFVLVQANPTYSLYQRQTPVTIKCNTTDIITQVT